LDTENPNIFHHIPLHNQKLGKWFAVNVGRNIGSVFFHDAVDSE
jgi:hypothetical protein